MHTFHTVFFTIIVTHAMNTTCAAITVRHASLSSNFAANFAIDASTVAVIAISSYIAVTASSTEIPWATDTATDQLVTNFLA